MKTDAVFRYLDHTVEAQAQKYGIGTEFDQHVPIEGNPITIRMRYWLKGVGHTMPDTYLTLLTALPDSEPPTAEYSAVDIRSQAERLREDNFWETLQLELAAVARFRAAGLERRRLDLIEAMKRQQPVIPSGYELTDVTLRLPLSARALELIKDMPAEFLGYLLGSSIDTIIFSYTEAISRGENLSQLQARIDRLQKILLE